MLRSNESQYLGYIVLNNTRVIRTRWKDRRKKETTENCLRMHEPYSGRKKYIRRHNAT